MTACLFHPASDHLFSLAYLLNTMLNLDRKSRPKIKGTSIASSGRIINFISSIRFLNIIWHTTSPNFLIIRPPNPQKFVGRKDLVTSKGSCVCLMKLLGLPVSKRETNLINFVPKVGKLGKVTYRAIYVQ